MNREIFGGRNFRGYIKFCFKITISDDRESQVLVQYIQCVGVTYYIKQIIIKLLMIIKLNMHKLQMCIYLTCNLIKLNRVGN